MPEDANTFSVNINMQVNILDSLFASADTHMDNKRSDIEQQWSQHSSLINNGNTLVNQIKANYNPRIISLQTKKNAIIKDVDAYSTTSQNAYQAFETQVRDYYNDVKHSVGTIKSVTDTECNAFTTTLASVEAKFSNVQLEPIEMTFDYTYRSMEDQVDLTGTETFSGNSMAEIEQQKNGFPAKLQSRNPSSQFVGWVQGSPDTISNQDATQV